MHHLRPPAADNSVLAMQALLAAGGLIGFVTKGSTASLGVCDSCSDSNCCSPLAVFLMCVTSAGGGVGAAAVLGVCSAVSLQCYKSGTLCKSATALSLGE
jgi:uncharacterized membrane protein (UPF0136 family)